MRTGQRWEQVVSRSTTVHVFRCGATALFALTTDPTGQILPSQIGSPVTWQFERSVTLQLDNSNQRRDSIRATLAAIARHGFYLTHAAIHATSVEELISPRKEA